MRLTRSTQLALLAGVFIVLLAPAVRATPEVAKKEGLKCTTCHDKAGSKLLTSKGKYFEYRRTLVGYDDVIREYKKCTTCHMKEPGSTKLTPTGMDMKAKGVTMEHVGKAPPSK